MSHTRPTFGVALLNQATQSGIECHFPQVAVRILEVACVSRHKSLHALV
jgi:hypothetical protein